MEDKSKTVNYSKENLVIKVLIHSNSFEIEAINLTTQTTYANTFELGKNIDYNEVYNFIVSGQATIKITTDCVQVKCSNFIVLDCYPTKKDEIKLIKAEIALLKEQFYTQQAEIKALKDKINNLEENNKVINITIYNDNTRRIFNKDDTVISFDVDKKRVNTILLIQANLCVHGEYNGSTTCYYIFGGKTTVNAQTENYSNNGGHGRPIPLMAVIKNHTDVGIQKLVLKWHLDMLPFKIINPNKSDHAQYYDGQTTSVYTVWEIQ